MVTLLPVFDVCHPHVIQRFRYMALQLVIVLEIRQMWVKDRLPMGTIGANDPQNALESKELGYAQDR